MIVCELLLVLCRPCQRQDLNPVMTSKWDPIFFLNFFRLSFVFFFCISVSGVESKQERRKEGRKEGRQKGRKKKGRKEGRKQNGKVITTPHVVRCGCHALDF